MAEASRQHPPGVIGELVARPHCFDFFRAVRLLDLAVRQHVPASCCPVGRGLPSDIESVRMRAAQSLRFPIGDVASVTWDLAPATMEVTFAGLTGPAGALPDFYTRELIERAIGGDVALADLLAIFDHRFLTLLFLAWERSHAAAAFEGRVGAGRGAGPERSGGLELEAAHEDRVDDITSTLLALMGLGSDELRATVRQRLGREAESLVPFVGRVADRRRPAPAVERMLSAALDLPVEVVQFRGRWLTVDESERRGLGAAGPALGRDAMVGSRAWDVQSCIRVRVGPMSYAAYMEFLPGGRLLEPMCELCRIIVGPEFDIEVQPVLRASEIPRGALGRRGSASGEPPSALGRNAFLAAGAADSDFDGATYFANRSERGRHGEPGGGRRVQDAGLTQAARSNEP